MRPRESEAWHRSRPTERILGEVVVVVGGASSPVVLLGLLFLIHSQA